MTDVTANNAKLLGIRAREKGLDALEGLEALERLEALAGQEEKNYTCLRALLVIVMATNGFNPTVHFF